MRTIIASLLVGTLRESASSLRPLVVTVRPEDSVAEVAKLLTNHEISAVPVCDEQDKPLGMVSEGDLMRAVREGK